MEKEIPQKVKEVAKKQGYSCKSIGFEGHYEDWEVYGLGNEVDDDVVLPTGLPTLILWNGNNHKIVSGFDALTIISVLYPSAAD